MPHKKGHINKNVKFRERLDKLFHGDRLKKKRLAKESSGQTTVSDSQKRSMKSTASMSDAVDRDGTTTATMDNERWALGASFAF